MARRQRRKRRRGRRWDVRQRVIEEALQGFMSTTRAATVAKAYAGAKGGWVYILFVNGAYLIPDQTAHKWTNIFGEQEIAMPGSVSWDRVKGFRQVEATDEKKFTGPIYLRDDFDASESAAAEQCYKLLSGMKQP
jgi:hypothetical protein